jgi:hypothetical protein
MTSACENSAGKPVIMRLQRDVHLNQARFKGIGCGVWTRSSGQAVVNKVTLKTKPSNKPT